MSKDNKASRIIVSSMTLIEVGDFLKETVFSSDAISKLEERVDKKNKDYEKAYKVWLYNHDENEFCKIFNPKQVYHILTYYASFFFYYYDRIW